MRPENGHQAHLLRLVRDGGPQSRAELGEAVELSKSKVAIELDRLAELGFVDVVGLAASRGGRRSQMVALSASLRFVGIDIGATSIDVAIMDGELRLLGHAAAPADVRDGPNAVLDQVIDLVAKVRAELSGPVEELSGVGVGVPGPVSQGAGALVSPPIMPGWSHFPIRDMLGAALGAPVMVDNDVNIMALGVLHAGTARSVRDLLFVKVGTGIGCGIVVGGEIYRGVTGSAGDIGHIQVDDNGPICTCGNTGCLEAVFGGAALARDAEAAARSGRSPRLADRLAELTHNRTIPAARATPVGLTARDVGIAAAAGDPVAIQIVRQGGHRLGQVLASLVSFFNPALLVIGGGVAAGLGHPLLAEIRSVVYRRSLPLATGNLPIVLSELGGTAGVVGAARFVSDSVFNPT
jgi:glucokinase-like ROK family protein